ncbi:helix-turn-helix domain-containing protein [Amycolatopsis sp. NPDC005961]|uniref:helix-turn-helix domain-containing protein n=1 Tax=Amycolatopsis sp. NPDC005961 TaxID=3156720 RepID=UPI003409A417
MSVAEAASYAGCHSKTMLAALRRRECQGYQRRAGCVWRIYPRDLDAWIRGEAPSTRKAA